MSNRNPSVKAATLLTVLCIACQPSPTELDLWQQFNPGFEELARRIEKLAASLPDSLASNPAAVTLDPPPAYRDQGWEIYNTDVIMLEHVGDPEATITTDLDMSAYLKNALRYYAADQPPAGKDARKKAEPDQATRVQQILDVRYVVIVRTLHDETVELDRSESGRVVGASGALSVDAHLADMQRGEIVLSFPLQVAPDRSFHYLKSDNEDEEVAMLRGAVVSRSVNAKFAIAKRLGELTGGDFKVGS